MSEEQKDFLPPVAQAEAVYSSARIPIASVIEILPNFAQAYIDRAISKHELKDYLGSS